MGTLDGPTAVNRSQNMSAPISKKRKFVADGVFYAELNEMLARELSEQNYAGVEVRVTPNRTEIIIKATHTQDVLGDRGRRIRELTAVSRSALASRMVPSSCTPRRSSTAASAPSPRPSRSGSSSRLACRSAAPATALSVT